MLAYRDGLLLYSKCEMQSVFQGDTPKGSNKFG